MPATTTPAGPISYLQAVASGATKAQGLKRPTLAALRNAAAACAIDCCIEAKAKGYRVSQHRVWCEAHTLAGVAALLLQINEKAWAVKPAVPETSEAVIREDGALPILSFKPGRFDGPYVAGDGIDLWSFSSEAAALRYCQALRREGAEPVALAENALGQWRPIPSRQAAAPAPGPLLPGEAPRSAPAPTAAPAPTLPELPENSRFASGRFEGLQPWGNMPGYVVQSQQQQQPQQAPAPVVASGPKARATAPAAVPADVKGYLGRFGLAVDGLLTVGASNAKLAKGKALAWPVILHHLPAKALAQAVAGPQAGPTAPRSRIDGLAELAKATNTYGLALAHNGCPWASAGCAAGCLAWAGHGGMSTTVAAARARRTLAMLADGRTYARAVLWAIARAYRQAQAKGLPLAVRLRGTDDSPVHLWRFDISAAEAQSLARRYGLPVAPGQGLTLPEALALAPAGSVRFYEYSKAPITGPHGLQAQASAGFDVTASLAADRPHGVLEAIRAVEAGFRVAVPVALPKGQPLPAVLILERGPLAVDLACIDGDATDHRWADPAGPHAGCDGVAVILRTKRSRGKGPEADAFSLAPIMDAWQPLAGGGRAMLRSQPWGL